MIKMFLIFGLIGINMVLIGFLYIVSVKWIKKIQAIEKKVYQLQKTIRGLQIADMRFNRKVDELQSETEQLSSHQELQQDHTTVEQPEKYQQALKLLKMGMSLEDVMNTCEIGRAEAELLQNLDGYQRFQANLS